MVTCSICDGATIEHGRASLRNKFDALFLRCQSCGFIFIPNPTWLGEAYAEPINKSDTGYVWRNLWARDQLSAMMKSFLNPDGTFLDYAAGYGLLVRLMRDAGYDFRWSDLYCENLFARGFEAPTPVSGPFEAVTAFEVFEHLTQPREEMQKLSAITPCLIFSTQLLPEPVPALADWWYYGLEHGQHVAFYSRKSLEALASQYGYQLATNGSTLHIFSRKAVPATVFSPPFARWKRLLDRVANRHRRVSLTMSDHDLIVKELAARGEKT